MNIGAGYYIALIGLISYGASLLFSLITLPLEYDASKKALKLLKETNTLSTTELENTAEVLNAAIKTYIADLFVSLIYFLRFLSLTLVFTRRK